MVDISYIFIRDGEGEFTVSSYGCVRGHGCTSQHCYFVSNFSGEWSEVVENRRGGDAVELRENVNTGGIRTAEW